VLLTAFCVSLAAGLLTCVLALVALAWALRRGRRRLRAVEAKLAEARGARETAEQAKAHQDRVMAMLSHELRNPIHGIVGILDLLANEVYGPVTDKQRQGIGQVRASAMGLLLLVEDHLQMARDEAGRLEVHLEDASPVEMLEEVARSVEWQVQSKHIQLRVETEQVLPQMHTDPGKVKRILVNLVTNAVKFTPDGGQVVVRVRRRDDRFLSISVADTGEGIAQGELEQIFEAFHQVGGGRAGGVGLGLSLVKRLVYLLGGEIHVGSHVGRGTTFVVALPIRSAETREASDPEQRAVDAQGAVLGDRRPRQ